jgi:hypothetical protein
MDPKNSLANMRQAGVAKKPLASAFMEFTLARVEH